MEESVALSCCADFYSRNWHPIWNSGIFAGDRMMTVARFGLMDDADIELDVAALELSELDHPGTDLSPYVAVLQHIADRVAIVGMAAQAPEEQAAALATVIHEELGFVGDAESYDAPLNADFIRVIDRRKGLPVSLSILYVAAARRMDWVAFALNTPGHVLVRIGKEEAVIIDPFNGGRIMSSEGLTALLQRMLGDATPAEQHVAPMSNRSILMRLLLNQSQRAEQAGDHHRARKIYERAVLVAPDHPDAWWQLARLQLQESDVDAARHSLSSMLEVTRDPERRELAAAALDAMAPR